MKQISIKIALVKAAHAVTAQGEASMPAGDEEAPKFEVLAGQLFVATATGLVNLGRADLAINAMRRFLEEQERR